MRNNFTKTCPERQAEKVGKQTPGGLKDVYLEEESILLKEKKSLGFEEMSIDEFLAWTPDLSEDQSKASRILDLQEGFRQLEKNRKVIFAEEVVVEELNAKHAVVHTDRFYILTEKEDPVLGGTNFTLESKQSFKDMYENQTIETWDGKKTTKAKLWLESADRRQYDGIVFNPNPDDVDSLYYNIWKGFAINPVVGRCERYRSHVENVICNGNQEYFNYLWRWCARLVQKPHLLGEVVPVKKF